MPNAAVATELVIEIGVAARGLSDRVSISDSNFLVKVDLQEPHRCPTQV